MFQDSLRCRFSNDLKWYTTLVDRKNLLVKDYVDVIRDHLHNMSDSSELESYGPGIK